MKPIQLNKCLKSFKILHGLAGERCQRGPPVAGDQLLWGPVLPGRGYMRGQDFSEYNVDERAMSQRVSESDGWCISA